MQKADCFRVDSPCYDNCSVYQTLAAAASDVVPGEIHVWCSPLSAPEACIELTRWVLCAEERAKAGRFHFEEHRRSFIASHGLLRMVLACYRPLPPALLEFVAGPDNKPYLRNEPRLRFNLSHSGDLALIAVAFDHDVGVDLELIRPMPDLEDVAEQFFSPLERQDLLSLAPQHRLRAFYDCWTRKEAFVKAIGEGLLYPLDRFQVTVLPWQPPAFVALNGRPADQTQWSLHDIRPSERYAAALAVEARGYVVRCWRFESFGQALAYFSPPASA